MVNENGKSSSSPVNQTTNDPKEKLLVAHGSKTERAKRYSSSLEHKLSHLWNIDRFATKSPLSFQYLSVTVSIPVVSLAFSSVCVLILDTYPFSSSLVWIRVVSPSARLSLFSESSIPTLNSIIKRDEEKLNLFRVLKSKQMKIEEHAIQRSHLDSDKPSTGYQPPE